MLSQDELPALHEVAHSKVVVEKVLNEELEHLVVESLTAIMTTIMMGKMEMEFPDMYMMNRFIGTCLKEPNAKSQLRLIFRLGSTSLDASACTRAAPPELNPGGDGS